MAPIPHSLIVDDMLARSLVNPDGMSYRSELEYWFIKPINIPTSQSLCGFGDVGRSLATRSISFSSSGSHSTRPGSRRDEQGLCCGRGLQTPLAWQ